MSGPGSFATWRGTRTKSALTMEADIRTLVRVEFMGSRPSLRGTSTLVGLPLVFN
jgi:hypothetical protein